MVLDAVSNFVRGTADAAVGTDDTTVSVEDASIFPDPETDGEFNVVIWDVDNFPRPDEDGDVEIMRVTARDTTADELTVTRAQEMTSAASHPEGSAIHLSPTAKMFSDIESTFGDFWDAGAQELTGDVNNTNTTTQALEADEIPVDGQMEVDGQNTGGYVFGQGGPLEVNKRSVFLQGKSSGHLRIRNEDFDGDESGASYIYQTRESGLDDRHELRENVRGKRIYQIFPDRAFEFGELPVQITANATGQPMFEVLDEGNARGIRVNEFGTVLELERPGSTFRIEGVQDTRIRIDVDGAQLAQFRDDGTVRMRDADGDLRELDGDGNWVIP